MKNLLLSFLLTTFLLPFHSLQGQTQQLTIEDVVLKGKTTLAPEKPIQLNWVPGTTNYSFVSKQGEDEILAVCNADGKQRKDILKLSSLNEDLKKTSPGSKPLPRLPQIKWTGPSTFYFIAESKLYTYNISTSTLSLILSCNKEAENTDIEEKNLSIAYTLKNNLYIASANGKEIQVSHETNPAIVCGQAAHRNEFAIAKGTFWSPLGNSLAWYRMDQTMVTDYPILDLENRPAQGEPIKYPMAGMKSHQVSIGVYSLKTGQTIFLKTPGPDEHYMTNITWSPDEQQIYVAELNRGQNEMKLNVYDARNGDFVKTLFEEKNDKYVEPEHGPVFLKNNSLQFLWFSKKDGYNHLYLFDPKGGLRQLTKGNWVVTDFLGFDKSGESFYYASTEVSPLERHIYKYNLKKDTREKLTSTPGMHTATFNTEGSAFIDNVSSATVPRIVSIIDSKGKGINTILTASNPLKDYKMGQLKLFTIKAEDNSDLYCRMILPPNFDENKKYPTFVYLYGGPNVQLVTNSWLGGADLWLHYMAQHGYVVFTLDNRGSANRGEAFEQATFRRLGTVEVADQMKGIEYLKNQKFVDTTRMALHGWSFGGFMTTTIMSKHPGIFKAAVAGGSVIDWKYYEVMYTERYMDTPQENPQGYEAANLLNSVKNLKGRLMIIHGTSDDVVVWQHSLMYLKKCVDNGIPIDYFVYPEHKHNVIGPDRVHLLKKITDYFDQNVKNAAVTVDQP